MLGRVLLLATLAAGAAIGAALPAWHSPSAVPPSEVSLTKSSDGQFYVDVDVNGHSTHFLVDTGASEIALSEADARAAGIAVDPASYELIGHGASGLVRGQQVTIGRIDLQGIHEKDVGAVVVPAATVSLLGQPFLDKLDEIVIRKDEMRLRYEGPATGQ